jgi:hypothetical protein
MFNDRFFERLQKDLCYGAKDGGTHGYTFSWLVNLTLEAKVILVSVGIQQINDLAGSLLFVFQELGFVKVNGFSDGDVSGVV